MKWLIILGILLLVVMFVTVRFRRHIQMGLQLLKMFRQMRKMSKPPEKKIEKQTNSKDVPLVRCERCGKWTPQTDGLNLRSKTFYCSSKCMEKAAKLQSLVD